MSIFRHLFLVIAVALASGTGSFAADHEGFRKLTDLQYGQAGRHELLLDLYLPQGPGQPPLVVYIHGGAWRSGSKDGMPLEGLIERGFAIASVGYRLSPVARFPAQVHDIKAAIRFLRGKQREYGYSADQIAIAGSSAGGHLAALVGVTNGHPELEGEIGNQRSQSSDVQAIVSYYGASNLLTILKQSTPHGLGVRIPALQLLLGSQPEDDRDLAKLASPIFHVDRADPPLLLLHGDQDPQMPINQSIELLGKYQKLQAAAEIRFVHGGGHGGKQFYDPERTKIVADFLGRRLSAK